MNIFLNCTASTLKVINIRCNKNKKKEIKGSKK